MSVLILLLRFLYFSEDGDKAGRKPLPYLGILPVRFLVDFYLPEGTTFYCLWGESILDILSALLFYNIWI